MIAVARTTAVLALARYRRSWGLWLLLLLGPVAARFMIGDSEQPGIVMPRSS